MYYHTIAGTYREVTNITRKMRMNNKAVKELSHNIYEDDPVPMEERYTVAVVEVYPYSPEEEQERLIYGDPDHENYLLSDDYEYESRSEAYDWLKNE